MNAWAVLRAELGIRRDVRACESHWFWGSRFFFGWVFHKIGSRANPLPLQCYDNKHLIVIPSARINRSRIRKNFMKINGTNRAYPPRSWLRENPNSSSSWSSEFRHSPAAIKTDPNIGLILFIPPSRDNEGTFSVLRSSLLVRFHGVDHSWGWYSRPLSSSCSHWWTHFDVCWMVYRRSSSFSFLRLFHEDCRFNRHEPVQVLAGRKQPNVPCQRHSEPVASGLRL